MKRLTTVYAAVLSLILSVVLVLTACGSGNGASGGEKVLTVASGVDILGFDIHNHGNISTEAVHVNLFNYLIKKDKDQNKIPDLATSWEQIDATTWRFHLREGVKFHNGDPFTAADVKFTLERVAKDNKLVEYPNYKQIKEVKIVDDHTVDIVTNGPDPILLSRLSRVGSSMLPSKYIQEKGWDYFLQHPIGTGPYQFSQWIKDDRLELVKNPNYFGGQPKWDKLVFRVVPEDSTRVSELLTGGVDLAINIPPTDLERINNNAGTHTIQFPVNRVMSLGIRMTPGTPLADPRVREAIDLAIDRQEIIDNLLGGAGTPTRTVVSPGNFGAQENLYKQNVHDKERAKALLAEAGYSGGFEVTLSSASGRNLKDRETAEFIASKLGEIGIKVKLDISDWSTFSQKYASKKVGELFLYGYGNSLYDASLSLNILKSTSAKGLTDYNNPEVDKLIDEAEKNANLKEREKQYQQIQDIVAKDRPYIYLFQLKTNYGVNERIDFQPRLDEMLYADEIIPKQGR